MLKFIFFDLSDTLVDTQGFFKGRHMEVNKEILERFGFKTTEEEILSALRTSYRKTERFWKRKLSFSLILCRNLGIKVSKKTALKMDHLFREKFVKSVKLMDSAEDTLSKLKEWGFGMAVVSNYDEKTAYELVRYLGIEKYLEQIVGIDTTGLEKAKFEPFVHALKRLRLKPHEAIMVGDDEHQDIIPAKKLGIKTIKVSDEKAEKSKADLVISNLEDLQELPCIEKQTGVSPKSQLKTSLNTRAKTDGI